jgi:WD40 repeat protein
VQAASGNEKLCVFISYAREDLAVAERLVALLEAEHIDVKIDRRNLPYATEFKPELLDFIRQADAALFLISHWSVNSEWCRWEREQIVALNKRLAPVLIEDVALERIPEPLRTITFVPFTDPATFETTAGLLAIALKSDLEWVKNHTRWGERARRWDERGRKGAALLRGVELTEAEAWALARPREAPALTELQRNYIALSRRGVRRWQRNALVVTAAVAVALGGLAAYAFHQRDAAIGRLVQLMVDRGRRDIGDGYLHGAWLWFAQAFDTDSGGAGRTQPDDHLSDAWRWLSSTFGADRQPARMEAHRRRIAAARSQLPELVHDGTGEADQRAVRFAPDGDWVLFVSGRSLSPMKIDVHGIAHPHATISDDGRCWTEDAAFLPGRPVSVALVKWCSSEPREVEIRQLEGSVPPIVRKLPENATARLSADGSRLLVLVAGGPDQTVDATVHDVPAWKELWRMPAVPTAARLLGDLSRDGRIAATLVGSRLRVQAIGDHAKSAGPTVEIDVVLDGEPSELILSPDARFAFIRSARQSQFVIVEQRMARPRQLADGFIGIVFSPDACHFLLSFERQDRRRYTEVWNACGDLDATPRIIEHETGLEQWTRALAQGAPASVTAAGAGISNPMARPAMFGPDGETVVTVSNQMDSFRVWQRWNGQPVTPGLSLLSPETPHVGVSPNGRLVAASTRSGRHRIWRLDAIAPSRVLLPIRNRIDALFFAPNGNQLIAASFEGYKAVWNLAAGDDAEAEFYTASNDTSAVLYDAINHRLVSGGFGKAVFVWDITGKRLAAPVIRLPARVTELFLDGAAKHLAVVVEHGGKRSAQLFELPSGRELSPLSPLQDSLLAMGPDGRLALARAQSGIAVLDTRTWRAVGPTLPVEGQDHVRFSADGKTIQAIGPTQFRQFSVTDGRELHSPVVNQSAMNSRVLSVSPDGTRALLQGRLSESGQVIDTATGRPVSGSLDHPAAMRRYGFAPGGKVVYASTARSIFLWDADTGAPLGPPLVHDHDVQDIAIDRDVGQLAVSLSVEGRSRLVLWRIDQAMGGADSLRLAAEVNSDHFVDALGGFIPLQPEQFAVRWAEHNLTAREPPPEWAGWRMAQLRRAAPPFAKAFHLAWARREGLRRGELDIAEIGLTNPKGAQRIALLERAIAAGIPGWSLRNDLAQAYAGDGRWPEAVDMYRKTLSLRQDEPRVWRELAVALLKAGSPAEQHALCSNMMTYFIDWYPTAWNVIAASCAYFPGRIEARKTLLEHATRDPAAVNAVYSNPLFRSIMLYRENGIEAAAGSLTEEVTRYVDGRILQALLLRHRGDAAGAQSIVEEIRAQLASDDMRSHWQARIPSEILLDEVGKNR